jgi:hypothetical protein
MNVSQVINAACRQLGFTPNAAEAADAMEALNLMLKEWSSTSYGLHQVTRENFALTISKASYTIGKTAGMDLDTIRPSRIENAFIRSDDMDYSVKVYFSFSEYAGLALKSSEGMPSRLYFERSFPNGTILLYPTPDAAYDLWLYSFKPLAAYTSLSDDVGLPPEYETAIKFNLAVELASEFGRDVTAQTAVRAEQSLSSLKRLHSQPVPQINTNPFGACGRRYDITSDTYL